MHCALCALCSIVWPCSSAVHLTCEIQGRPSVNLEASYSTDGSYKINTFAKLGQTNYYYGLFLLLNGMFPMVDGANIGKIVPFIKTVKMAQYSNWLKWQKTY